MCFSLSRKGCNLYFAMAMPCTEVSQQNFCKKICLKEHPYLTLPRTCNAANSEAADLFPLPTNSKSSRVP